MRKPAVVIALAVVCCFVLASLAQATDTTTGKRWTRNNLRNKQRVTSIPIWQITQDPTKTSVKWVDHAPNPRFAIYDPGTPADETDDVVLDKETGLIWERNPLTLTGTWAMVNYWAYTKFLAGRHGWRVPTAEEFGTLGVDNTSDCLPAGHPFIGFDLNTPYWTQTTDRINSAYALACYCDNALGWEDFTVGGTPKTSEWRMWFVRGGNGHDAY
ncbi:MAG: Lcl C-terminal domain-containing protein [Candidatus Hermodarchaeia archaeon]|jgi:hypothetical protein